MSIYILCVDIINMIDFLTFFVTFAKRVKKTVRKKIS